jgi:glycosyltransferase involved in cell wall biosynthesis
MSDHKPFFSIIIPALNEEKYLPNLLGDLVKQTFKDFEVIVVDGKSDDKTVEKSNAFSKTLNIRIITSERRHVCSQRNLGAKNAKSEIIIFSDADNRLKEYFLQGIKYRFESMGADILSPHIEPDIKNTQNVTLAKAFNLFLEAQMNFETNVLLESLVVIKKSSFEKIGGFDDKIDYAEGRDVMTKAKQYGLVTKIIKDPSYSFSFRRLRKYGVLGTLTRMARIGISSLLEGDKNKKARQMYPMLGGALFEVDKKNKITFQKKVAVLLKKIQDF